MSVRTTRSCYSISLCGRTTPLAMYLTQTEEEAQSAAFQQAAMDELLGFLRAHSQALLLMCMSAKSQAHTLGSLSATVDHLLNDGLMCRGEVFSGTLRVTQSKVHFASLTFRPSGGFTSHPKASIEITARFESKQSIKQRTLRKLGFAAGK
jgi:hypothetical protein